MRITPLYVDESSIRQNHFPLSIEYYGALLASHAHELKEISPTIVAGAYFSRQPFVETLTTHGFVASNAILLYPYTGPKTGKPGRPRKYEQQVDKLNLDTNYFTPFVSKDGSVAYEGKVYVKDFKRRVKCVVVHKPGKNGIIQALRHNISIANREHLLDKFFIEFGK